MYAVADQLDPDRYLALARAGYAEMALAGMTGVGEFHYLHHGPGGVRYAEPNAMAEALRQAAADAGIRLTLLDTCYLAGGLTADGPLPLNPSQLRFSDGTAQAWADRVAELRPSAGLPVGAAIHSVRAVPRDQLPVVAAAGTGRPLHVHLSEQPAENEACLAYYGCTPTALLEQAGRARPAHHRRARHPSAAPGHRDPRPHRHHQLPVPDHRTRSGRRHRPGPGAVRCRQPAEPGLGPARGDRPVRGGARRWS